MSKRKKFIMVMAKKTPLNPYIFKDLYDDNRVLFLQSITKEVNNQLLDFIQRVHLNGKINRIISLPYKNIWGYSLNDVNWEEDVDYYIIFTKVYPIEPSYLVELQKKHSIKYILYLEDAIGDDLYSSYERNMIGQIKFDYVFTIDNKDAEKYNFFYDEAHYSIISESVTRAPEYDIYFAGQNKGRYKRLIALYESLQEKKLSFKFRITGVGRRNQQYKDNILYNQRISYPEVIEEAKKSNCILEVLCDVQTGATLRYNEAICYNKKLLTNNKNVVNLPFYNPEYIHVFEKPEDIDWNWVKERIPVDYHYDGRFSPTHLIDRIIGLEEQKEAQAGGEKK